MILLFEILALQLWLLDSRFRVLHVKGLRLKPQHLGSRPGLTWRDGKGLWTKIPVESLYM